MARILVGIPTRNRPHYLREAVLSVLAQSMGDFRLVVSENPSLPEVAAENAAWIESLGDARVSYHLQALDGGEYGQGRYQIGQCREEYYCMLHDDDRMEPDYLAQALAVLDFENDLAFFSSGQYLIDGQGQAQPALTEEYAAFQARDRFAEGRMENIVEPLLEFGLFSISGAVFRTASVADYGLVDPDLGGIYPFEFNVFLRIAERGLPAWYTPKRLIAYRWHDASMRQADGSILTRYMVETLVELLERRRFQGRAERLRRRLLAYNRRNLGYILLVAGERRCALSQLLNALCLHPFGPSLWAYWIAALLAPGLVRRRWKSRVNLTPPSPSWAAAIPPDNHASPSLG
jgi:glycosyltransferase involved in cell wall biosynthesis